MTTFFVIIVVVLISFLIGLAVCLMYDAGQEQEQRRAVTRAYTQLDTDYRQFREAATGALDQANRDVQRAQQLVLQQRQQGHDARVEIIRLAAEASRREP